MQVQLTLYVFIHLFDILKHSTNRHG